MKKLFYLLTLSIMHTSLNAQPTVTPEVVLVKSELNPTGHGAATNEYKVHNGKLYFNAWVDYANHGNALWVTDGTAAGTNKLISLANQYSLHAFYPAGNNLVFLAHTGWGYYSYSSKLYSTDGTAAGTHMIAGNVLAANDLNMVSDHMTDYNGKVYFSGNDGIHGYELWATDGTTAGTVMVKDIAPGADSSRPACFTVFNNKLYFITNNAVDKFSLYVTDGTSSGTQMIKEVTMTEPVFGYSCGMAEYNNRLYFILYDGSAGSYLYTTDGTAAGTSFVQNMPNMSRILRNFTFNNKLYLVTDDGSGSSYLWQSDGTTTGTSSILTAKKIDAIGFKNHLFISKMEANSDAELISSTTGGATGTTLLQISSGSLFLYPHDFVVNNGTLYFSAPTNHSYQNIYSTDGTVAGTVIVGPHNSSFQTYCGTLNKDAILNDSLFFDGEYIKDGRGDLYKLRLNVQPNDIRDINNDIAEVSLYPNPAGTTTMLSYKLNQADILTISISDMTGRTLQTFIKKQDAGIYMQMLDVAYSAGMYLVHIKGTHADTTLKLIVK